MTSIYACKHNNQCKQTQKKLCKCKYLCTLPLTNKHKSSYAHNTIHCTELSAGLPTLRVRDYFPVLVVVVVPSWTIINSFKASQHKGQTQTFFFFFFYPTASPIQQRLSPDTASQTLTNIWETRRVCVSAHTHKTEKKKKIRFLSRGFPSPPLPLPP